MEYNTEHANAASSELPDEGNVVVPGQPESEPDGPACEAAMSPGTGEPRVDAALKLLDQLSELPVSDHPELFEHVHTRLTEVLGELAWGPGEPADPQGS